MATETTRRVPMSEERRAAILAEIDRSLAQIDADTEGATPKARPRWLWWAGMLLGLIIAVYAPATGDPGIWWVEIVAGAAIGYCWDRLTRESS